MQLALIVRGLVLSTGHWWLPQRTSIFSHSAAERFFALGGFCCGFSVILRYYPLLSDIKIKKILLLVFLSGSRKGYRQYTLSNVSGEDGAQRAHIIPHFCAGDELDMVRDFGGALLRAACAHLSQQGYEVGAVGHLEPPHDSVACHGYRRALHGLPNRQVLGGHLVDQYGPESVETFQPVVQIEQSRAQIHPRAAFGSQLKAGGTFGIVRALESLIVVFRLDC